MTLTVLIEEVDVKNAGENFKGMKHIISAKLILKEGLDIVLERSFSEGHKSIHDIKATMEKIRLKMAEVKKIYEAEKTLKVEAEKEVSGMKNKLTAVEVK